jgi:hypothetical protein
VPTLALASGADAIVCLTHPWRESAGADSRLSLFPRTDKENPMSSKKPTNEHTSARVASTAAKLLSNPRTPASVKSVAASALTQKARASKSKGK